MKNETVPGKPKKKMKTWMKVVIILAVIAVVIIIGINVLLSKMMNTTESGKMAELHQVEVRDLSDSISLSGKVKSAQAYNVTSSAAAEIESVEVSLGDTVKAGDVICTLNKQDIENQIKDIENQIANSDAIKRNQYSQNAKALQQAQQDQAAQLNGAQAEINNAQAGYENAAAAYNETQTALQAKSQEKAEKKKELDKLDKEDETYANVKKQYDKLEQEENALSEALAAYQESMSAFSTALAEAQNNYSNIQITTEREVDAAQNVVDMQFYTSGAEGGSPETQLNELRGQLEDCTLKAQIDGIITAINVKNGDTNTPGAVIATVENDKALIMTGSVNEEDILKLSEGMEASVSSNAVEDKEYKGNIIKVVKVASETAPVNPEAGGEGSSAGSYSADISIKDSDLLIGMSVKAKITLNKKENVLCVPYDLIQYDEQENAYVIKAIDNGDGTYTAKKTPVNVGEEINYYTEITGGDLKEGENIVFDTEINDNDIFYAAPAMLEEEIK